MTDYKTFKIIHVYRVQKLFDLSHIFTIETHLIFFTKTSWWFAFNDDFISIYTYLPKHARHATNYKRF